MKYIILGKGGLYKIIKENLKSHEFCGFYDDNPSDDKSYLGKISDFKYDRNFFIAIAAVRNMLLREKIINTSLNKGGFRLNAISPSASISDSTKIGFSNIICSNSNVGANVNLGNGNIVFSNTTIEHDAVIRDNVNIAPGVTICGSVKIESNVFIGAGATIVDNIYIGKNSVIGAGSLVLKDVPEGILFYGSPGHAIRKNEIYK